MAKKRRFNRCVVTEKDIIFDIVYERLQGYTGPKGLQTKNGVKRMMRENLKGLKYIKGQSPKFTEWHPISECEQDYAFASAKYCFSCGISTLRKFIDNTNISFSGDTMGILGLDGKIVDAYSFSTDIVTDYGSVYEEDYFKWAGENAHAIYLGQRSYMERAYIGVKIPDDRLTLSIESSYKNKLENIKDETQLKNIKFSFDKLASAYSLVLKWVKKMSENPHTFDEPIPDFRIDFREQDLFANV